MFGVLEMFCHTVLKGSEREMFEMNDPYYRGYAKISFYNNVKSFPFTDPDIERSPNVLGH